MFDSISNILKLTTIVLSTLGTQAANRLVLLFEMLLQG